MSSPYNPNNPPSGGNPDVAIMISVIVALFAMGICSYIRYKIGLKESDGSRTGSPPLRNPNTAAMIALGPNGVRYLNGIPVRNNVVQMVLTDSNAAMSALGPNGVQYRNGIPVRDNIVQMVLPNPNSIIWHQNGIPIESINVAQLPEPNYTHPSAPFPIEPNRNVDNSSAFQQQQEESAQNERFQKILSSVIHKKVRSKKKNQFDSDKDDDSDSSAISLCEIPSGDDDDSINESMRSCKSDLLVETLRSIRNGLNLNADSLNYSSKSCPICCEDYRKGDDIVWSKNHECKHTFHTDCITQWLMNHDECPLCRNQYLV